MTSLTDLFTVGMTNTQFFNLLFAHSCLGPLVNYLEGNATGFPPWNIPVFGGFSAVLCLSRDDENPERVAANGIYLKHIQFTQGHQA